MISETYDITLKSPMGLKKGSVSFTVSEEVVKGTIQLLGSVNEFTGRILESERFIVCGALETPTGPVEYDIHGAIGGGELKASMNSAKGLMELRGIRKNE